MNKFAILWLCCAMMTGALLFKTSQHVTDGRQRLENITAEMRSEEDTLRVLQAEWSYLNQPERLEKLAAQYLKLAPMKGRQFIAATDIPLRPAAAPEPAAMADALAEVTTASAAENRAAELQMVTTSAPAVAVPLRKPAGLRLPAAYAPPTLKPPAPKAAAAKQPVQNQKAAAASNAAVRRDFLDVLDSLDSGGTR